MPTGYPKNGINKGWFKNGSNPVFTAERNKKISESKMGEKHPLWKGIDVGYKSLHEWINNHFKKENQCEFCGTKESKKFEWAVKEGNYTRNRKDYLFLCCSCHRKYDRKYCFGKLSKYKNELCLR
jgi:hypothetical protein